ncbi:MAG TPA: cell division protein FtsA [Terriglobales bacterium]|nr:cell division protein FtsA [Terriglobales bacterium]
MAGAAELVPLNILDLGTAGIRLVQVVEQDGLLRYAGHVTAASRGMRKGAVVGLADAADAIRGAAAQLEQTTGMPVERVFLSLTGAHVRGMSSQAGVALTSRSREITHDDARRVLDLARAIALPPDRQILHVVPQEFVLDRQGGIHEPVGMLATRLEAKIYAITVMAAAKDNLVLAANHAGLEVVELIFAPLASAEACLASEDRHAGVALVDMGAGSTGVLVYRDGQVEHAAVVPIGGDHFTSDISIGLRTPPQEAERIKCGFGMAEARAGAATSAIEVPSPEGSVASAPTRLVPLRLVGEWIEPRARELVQRLHAELSKGPGLGAGIVLAGGAWRLQGLAEMLAASTGTGVRMAAPQLVEGMPEELEEPEYAFAVGACYYAHRIMVRQQRPVGLWERLRARWASLT